MPEAGEAHGPGLVCPDPSIRDRLGEIQEAQARIETHLEHGAVRMDRLTTAIEEEVAERKVTNGRVAQLEVTSSNRIAIEQNNAKLVSRAIAIGGFFIGAGAFIVTVWP